MLGVTVETRDLLSEAAVEYANLKGDDYVDPPRGLRSRPGIHAG